ncbi:unnamed protein product [Kluyveromyces dobzhanskii CBS 2104]|uniref:WGS project CCBQ000000000 data, contig 00011 n=1 Tax=Kluyveromyces dobzhanskii CBS 2104 TaxID=1427455 RepID=A0A0A8L801_9SACH|nr:unnamed protein product [Kluyveromyces dobzhanskii CBS 2104]
MSVDTESFATGDKVFDVFVKEAASLTTSSDIPLPTDQLPAGHTAKLLSKRKRLPLRPILLCLATSFAGFIFGWDVGTIGGITSMASFQNFFGTRLDTATNTHYFPKILVGLIVSIFNISCAIGGLFLVKIADINGRKPGIYAAITIYSLGTLIGWTCGSSWWYFFFARFIAGLGVGATAAMIPMFISESAPINIRGAMVVLYQLMITLGILIGNVVNYGCKSTLNEFDNATWKIPVGLGNIWAAIVAVGVHFMPESPVFLTQRMGNILRAKESFARMNNLGIDDPIVDSHIRKLMEYDDTRKSTNGRESRFEFIFGQPRLGFRLFVGVLVMAFQQLSGANYFFYYGTTLFNSVGMEDPYVTSILLSTVNFISTFFGIYLVEKLGRRACLILGSIGMFTCMTVYASVGSFLLDKVPQTGGAIMIAFTCVYIMFFACTSGPVSFVVISELFPTRTKAISMAICTSVNWICNFFISLCTPFVTEKIGFKFGFVFSGCLFISFWVFTFLLKETKNKTSEEVDILYTPANK